MRQILLPFLILLFSVTSYARVCSPSTLVKEENVQYLTNFIESLSAANEGMIAVHDLEAAPSNSNMMLTLKRAADGFECAATIMAIYVKSKDKLVNASATANVVAFDALLTGAKGIVASIRDELNGVPLKQGDRLDRLTDFTLNADKAWNLFLKGIAGATYIAIVLPDDNAPLTTLNMSRAQRDRLLEGLNDKFEVAVKTSKEKRDSLTQPELAAWFIYDFLNKGEWKFSH